MMRDELAKIEANTSKTLSRPRFTIREFRNYFPRMLAFPERDVARIQPHPTAFKAIHWIAVVLGVFSIGFGGFVSYMFFRPDFTDFWIIVVPLLFFGIEGLVIIIWGLNGLLGKCNAEIITFDRRRKVVLQESRRQDPLAFNGIEFKYIAALQLCTGLIRHGEDDSEVFELNLVLRKPPCERIRLITRTGQSNSARIGDEAKRLAQFLDVPLWVHRGEDIGR